MCGRYALAVRPARVRQQLEDSQMTVDDWPEDDEVRETYNFAPGNNGIVYRADVPDYGAGGHPHREDQECGDNSQSEVTQEKQAGEQEGGMNGETKYKLQAMKWGLIPFWTKRNPDYGTLMRTINCRDDSLLENKGMWTTMKQRKRCIVMAQGFYEWLKKNGGRDKVPHFVKRKDGQMMCFAGLWDCVKYEGTDDKIYSYTVITTDVNVQLKFLHDRMPVILEPGSDGMRTWLDPNRAQWSKELQSLLKPFEGELECYPVNKEVGKVGNNSPSFIVPLDSAENKSNIANFFGNQKKLAASQGVKKEQKQSEDAAKADATSDEVKRDPDEQRGTTEKIETTEDNAPLPAPPATEKSENVDDPRQLRDEDAGHDGQTTASGLKRSHDATKDGDTTAAPAAKVPKRAEGISSTASLPEKKSSSAKPSPAKSPPAARKQTRSATSNGTAAKKSTASPSKERGSQAGNRKITAFFGK